MRQQLSDKILTTASNFCSEKNLTTTSGNIQYNHTTWASTNTQEKYSEMEPEILFGEHINV
jgi:hypothetical protein